MKNDPGLEDEEYRIPQDGDQATSVGGASPPPQAAVPHPEQVPNGAPEVPGSGDSSDDEFLPPTLMHHYDPSTGLVLGRSPILAKYLVMKAKHRYVLEEHEVLVDELELLKAEEISLRASKDEALDRVLHAEIGPQALALTREIQLPTPETASHPPGKTKKK
jgi:hypothetical protein